MAVCKDCFYYKDKKCNKYQSSISDATLSIECKSFCTEKPKPKGVQIRDNKRKRNNAKMRVVKEDQIGLCRFVWVEYMIFKQVNGKSRPYKEVGNIGLQIENKVYLNDGTYKFVNNKHLKIKKVYASVPYGTSEKLIELYTKQKNK